MNEARKLEVLAEHAGVPLQAVAEAMGCSKVHFFHLRKGKADIDRPTALFMQHLRGVITALLSQNILPIRGPKRESERVATKIFLEATEKLSGRLAP